MVTDLVTGELMKKILLILLLISSFALAKQSWELTLLMHDGDIILRDSRVINGAPKEGRKRGSMRGPASSWGWQIVSESGSILKESRFVLPSHYCSSEEHVHIDSIEVVVTIPQVEGGRSVQIAEYSQGAELPCGAENRMRSAAPVKAVFDLPGGVQ